VTRRACAAGVLFAGDALATLSFLSGETGPQLVASNEEAERARDSLSRLEGLPANVVVVGHGSPFVGTPAEAVERARRGFLTGHERSRQGRDNYDEDEHGLRALLLDDRSAVGASAAPPQKMA
jgi:glyoxylase-like metal-dependent hydrolase (beta-lactamase superfamily II)